jgi:hypothetical protein
MYKQLLKKIAPIIYKEVYHKEEIQDEIPLLFQDIFHRIDYGYNDDLSNSDFSITEGNWQKLRDSQTQGNLKPEIYYYITETNTHYFITFTLYFATDWKWIGNHDNDLESMHFVVKKNDENPIIQLIFANPHGEKLIYYNDRYYEYAPRSSEYKKIVFNTAGKPRIYCQPGNAARDLWNLFRHFGEVGHGLFMVGHRNEISSNKNLLGFTTGKGYLCKYDPDDVSLYKDNLLQNDEYKGINYDLIPAEGSLWTARENKKIFATKKWKPQKHKFHRLPEVGKRLKYFKERGTQFQNNKIAIPSSTQGRHKKANSPFTLQLSYEGKFYAWVKSRWNSFTLKSTYELNMLMDPVLAWKIKIWEMFGEKSPYAEELGLHYIHHPCLDIYKP